MLSKKIISEIKKNADPGHALRDKVYHKYDGHKALGLKAPVLAGVLKKFKKEVLALSCEDVFSLASELAKTKIEENVFAGNYVLQLRLDCFGKENITFLDKYADNFISWSTVDDFCTDILHPLIFKYSNEVIELVKKWNDSKFMWKQRASVVAFTRKVGASGKFTQIGLSLCDRLLWVKEDLIRKAVGWALKDLMRGDKKPVFDYVKKIKKDGAPATITLYAIRDINGKERSDFLKK